MRGNLVAQEAGSRRPNRVFCVPSLPQLNGLVTLWICR